MVAALASFLARNAMAALVLAIGLQTTTFALVATWAKRALVAKALLVLFAGVPVLAIAAITILPVGTQAGTLLAVMAACPGAPIVFRSFRDRPVAVTIIAVVSLLAPLTASLWLAILDHAFGLDLKVASVTLARVTARQLIPLALGVGVASLWPRFAARLSRVAWMSFWGGFAIAIAVALYKGAPALWTVGPWPLLAVAVIVIGSIAMGHWAGTPSLQDRRLLATIAVLGNPALAIAVIAATYPGFRAGALLFGYLIARALALLPYTLWSRRRVRRPPGT